MKKSILITGCSSGIGLYCAQKLHEQGYNVVASCRKQCDVDKLKALGLNCIQLDLANNESINKGFKEALKLANNKLDILFPSFNNYLNSLNKNYFDLCPLFSFLARVYIFQ